MGRKDSILMNISPVKDTAKRDNLYKIANSTWTVTKWIWSTIIIVFLVSFAANVASAEAQKDYYINSLIRWLSTASPNHLQDFFRLTVLTALLLFVIITLLSVLVIQLSKSSATTELQDLLSLTKKEIEATREQEAAQKAKDEEGFLHYLYSIKETNQHISPKGFAQHSRTLVFTDVTLDNVFVHLHVIPDRPIFDIPFEQQKQFRMIQQHVGLSDDEREDYIQRLRFTWYSQLRQGRAHALQHISIDEVLGGFSRENPVAIVLGAPGSGKTTFLRWVAYHLADDLISSGRPSSANGSAPAYIPILIQTNDFAERFDRESLTLRQFLIVQLSEIHPNASAKVLDALEHGRCYVLFDGLDEGFSPQVQRHVTSSIHSFIIDYSVGDPQTHQANRFIITSRIADYEPEGFAKYAHYTLEDLDDKQIERFLAQWCSAIERDLVWSEQDSQQFAERETIEIGIQRQQRLHSILKTNPDIKELASNPLALTVMAFFQANGRDLLQYRFDIYKLVTRTLLDSWNQESGRRMFSGEEIAFVEDLLSRFADRLQDDERLLGRYDVEMITQQTIAEFYHLQVHEIKEHHMTRLVEMLRRSSGLFAEAGDDLFCFANQTYQDFFAALYLLRRSREERRQLAVQRFLSTRWNEPLLLMLIYKSAHTSRDEQKEVNEILQAILDAPGSSALVQHNLLFVMSSIVNGRLLVTDKTLRERIRSSAERLSQRSGHVTGEQQDLIAALIQQLHRQTTREKALPQPLKQS
jgi:hypothetical protein